MNLLDEAKNARTWIGELNRLLMAIRRGGGGGGESNTASNQGAGGVGLFNAKVGVDLQFRNINAASNKVTIVLDAGNKEVDIDIDPSKIDLDDLGNVNAPAPNDDDVLTYDIGTGDWIPEAPGGGGAAVNPFAFRRSGRGYTTWDYYTSTTQIATRNLLYAYPFIVPVSQSFDRIVIAVSTARVNGVARAGIYDDDGDVYPNNLILDSGEVDCSVIGYKTTVIAETLVPGLYWLALNSDGDADIVFRAMDYNQTSPIGYFTILGNDAGNFITNPGTHWSVAEVYGALPDPFTGGATLVNNQNLITVMLRKT